MPQVLSNESLVYINQRLFSYKDLIIFHLKIFVFEILFCRRLRLDSNVKKCICNIAQIIRSLWEMGLFKLSQFGIDEKFNKKIQQPLFIFFFLSKNLFKTMKAFLLVQRNVQSSFLQYFVCSVAVCIRISGFSSFFQTNYWLSSKLLYFIVIKIGECYCCSINSD